MLAPDTLVARTTAVLVSRRHNADIYALRGCEELDSHYRILEKILSISRLKTYSADETKNSIRRISIRSCSAKSNRTLRLRRSWTLGSLAIIRRNSANWSRMCSPTGTNCRRDRKSVV